MRELGGDGGLASFREPRFARGTRVVVRLARRPQPAAAARGGACSRPRSCPSTSRPGGCCSGAAAGLPTSAAPSSAPARCLAPRAPGHLEIRVPEPEGAELVRRVARTDGIALRVAARRGHAVAYAKSKPAIRELLAHMGAHDAVLSLDEAEVISRTRERANRATNCDEANLARQGAAARAQAEAIAALDLQGLDAGLRQVAALRLRHPDLSLAELGRRARPPLPKSTVAGRMRVLTRGAAGARRSGGSS